MGAVARGKGAGVRPPPNPDDPRQAEATDAAAMAMTPMLELFGLRREIHTLTRNELRRLAVACICGWVQKRSEQACESDDGIIGQELLG